MDIFNITGGNKLIGEIDISGSKNSVLPIMCAALLANSPSIINNVPNVKDVSTLLKIIEALGANIEFISKNSLKIDPSTVNKLETPYEMVKQMRASICLLGPLLAKYGQAKLSLPGGCVIGPRPVDMHLKGLISIGAKCDIKHGYINIKGKIKGGEVFLGGRFGSSVTGTANILMASVFSKGIVTIESAAMEPEITDLANYLNKMGAKITGIGSHFLKIEGVKSLQGVEYNVIPDRIECGTFLIAAAITKGDLFLKKSNPYHLRALIHKMIEIGADISIEENSIRIKFKKRSKATDIVTFSFPGFPTDLQAQMMALLAIGDGISVITEKIYPERFMHISELNRMGANISLEGNTAIIKGVRTLSGAPVMASDLRASAALVLAALVAKGESSIERVYHLDRGYDNFEGKLSLVGANIKRLKGK